MKRFSCPVCGTEIHFENSACLSCDTLVAYDPGRDGFASLPADPGPQDGAFCANRTVAGCNWMAVPGGNGLCLTCRHNRTIPDLDVDGNAALWAKLELAKRYLFYSLLRWRLPLATRAEDPQAGLAFDFVADTVAADGTVTTALTGHADGIVTLNVAEADDAERTARREAMREPYRTLIGHMRHEIGHYYWDRLIRDRGRQDAFRSLFGDERADYAAALERNYSDGPPAGWQQRHISAYAASHPWEDWAETWAHYIHIVDACETAHAYGMQFGGAMVEQDPYISASFEALMEDWPQITVAANSLNRSMGQPDLYPFALTPEITRKLGFVHRVVHDRV